MYIAIDFNGIQSQFATLEEEKKKAALLEEELGSLEALASGDITGLENPEVYRRCREDAERVKRSVSFRREFLEKMVTEFRKLKEQNQQALDQMDAALRSLEDE